MTINYGALAGIAALSSGINFAGGMYSSNVSSKKAKKLAAYQAELNYRYNKQWAQESPSLSRAGLESAGYNPMLAVQNGTVGGNASSFASPNTANDVDLGVGNGFSNAMDFLNIKNQTEQTASTISLQEAQGRNAIADAIGKEIHNEYLSEREQKELGQISAATDKLIRETSYMDQLAENMEAERRLQEMGIYVGAGNVRYSADKAYNATVEASKIAANQSGTNTNKTLVGDIAKSLVGAGLAIFVGNKIKLIKPVGDLIKVIPKNILIK